MSTPPLPEDGSAAEALLHVLVEHEAEEFAALPEAERRAELEALGYDDARAEDAIEAALRKAGLPSLRAPGTDSGAPPTPATADAATASPARPPAVADLGAARARRQAQTRWTPLLAAAAATAILGGSGVRTVAHWHPPLAVTWPTYVPPPSAHVVADFTRRRALRLCAQEYYGDCLDLLDQAKAIDPAGDEEQAVKDARQKIQQWQDRPTDGWEKQRELYSKPTLGDQERPLRRSPKPPVP